MSALVLAASAGALVEQVGSYAGLAAMLGLGIMALLYFAQAREVKRLREWAGREGERAAELAQRVQADPQRRVVAQPQPQPQPSTAAAQQQATAALYASVGATPPGAAAPPGQLARPAATPAAGLLPAPGVVPQPGAASAGSAGAGAAAAGAAAAGSGPAAPQAPAVPPAPQAPGAVPAPAGGTTTAPPAPSPGVGGPPAATPAAAAARTAAAQRSGSLSSYANGSTGQETRESAAARPEPLLAADDDRGLSTGRIAMYVGGGIATLLVGVVLMLVLTGGDDTQAPNDFGDTPAQQSEGGAGASSGAGSQGGSAETGSSTLSVAERRATKVAVLNGTTQTGLARNVGDKIEKERFTLGSIGTNPDQQIPATIIAYTDGHEPAARAVARIVGVSTASLTPADANTAASADADVVVTVGLDQTG